MANICLYKIKVKGTKKACYALVNMMPLYSYEKEFLDEEGTDEDFILTFMGDCKWAVDCYTSPMENPKPFTEEELDAVADGDHWDKTLKDKSVLLNCEIFCNSKDIDDSCWSVYVHYDRGKQIFDECPQSLHIKRGRDYDHGYDISLPLSTVVPDTTTPRCKVKFDGGTYWYKGDYQVGDLVYVEGAKSGCLGKVVERVEAGGGEAAFYNITSFVCRIGEFVASDIEAIWMSYKPKERKTYLAKLGMAENMTKKKFVSEMDKKWTEFAQKEDDWEKFLYYINPD